MRYTNYLVATVATLALLVPASCACSKDAEQEEPAPVEGLDANTFCFFYNWYGLPEEDGRLYHWAHDILPYGDGASLGRISGTNNDIATNYFPAEGIYSSKSRSTIRRQMEEMASVGIGVVALTWWKIADIGHQSIPTIMDEAARVGLKVCFHIEPYNGRTADSFKIDIRGLIDEFGSHPAFYRLNGKPLFFVYDSYQISQDDWKQVLLPDGANTIRGKDYDSYVIGLLLSVNDRYLLKAAGFDGAYTYFAVTGFTEGSTPSRWKDMVSWSNSQGMLFFPSVGPGYIDTRIRPWNSVNIRERENGAYYENMFNALIDAGAQFAAITSFNEWHEGTQIEPAKPMKNDDGTFTYLDYSPEEPDFYLKETKRHITNFVNRRNNR